MGVWELNLLWYLTSNCSRAAFMFLDWVRCPHFFTWLYLAPNIFLSVLRKGGNNNKWISIACKLKEKKITKLVTETESGNDWDPRILKSRIEGIPCISIVLTQGLMQTFLKKYWMVSKNPSIYNMIRWFTGPMGKRTRVPSLWYSKN